jgi:hypothetical protein
MNLIIWLKDMTSTFLQAVTFNASGCTILMWDKQCPSVYGFPVCQQKKITKYCSEWPRNMYSFHYFIYLHSNPSKMVGRHTGYIQKEPKWVKCTYNYNEYLITYLYKRKIKLNAWQDIGKQKRKTYNNFQLNHWEKSNTKLQYIAWLYIYIFSFTNIKAFI